MNKPFGRNFPLLCRKIRMLSCSRTEMLPDLAGDTSSAGQGIIISGIHDLYENSRTLHDASVEGGGERMETDHVSEFQIYRQRCCVDGGTFFR